MIKKVRDCIICGAPTLKDNKLCKKPECLAERQKRRIIAVPDDEQPPRSGCYLSLRNCVHDIPLEGECLKCDDEWNRVLEDISHGIPAFNDLPSNPRIKLQND